MPPVSAEVRFDGRAPALSRIAEKVTELSGLGLSIQEVEPGDQGYDIHARLAFACAQDDQLEVRAYRPGAVRAFYDEAFQGVPQPMDRFVQGLKEPAGTQAVYLRSHTGLDPTLLTVTILALEALGGRARDPISEEERCQYGTPITVAQLEERRRSMRRQNRLASLIFVLLLPLALPLWLVWFLAILVMMPWRTWKAYKASRDYL
jgi:hypothetical protein